MVSLIRALPPTRYCSVRLSDLIARFNEYHVERDVDLIRRAGIAAINAHEGQLRPNGEPYVTHPSRVAGIRPIWAYDETTIAAGLAARRGGGHRRHDEVAGEGVRFPGSGGGWTA